MIGLDRAWTRGVAMVQERLKAMATSVHALLLLHRLCIPELPTTYISIK